MEDCEALYIRGQRGFNAGYDVALYAEDDTTRIVNKKPLLQGERNTPYCILSINY